MTEDQIEALQGECKIAIDRASLLFSLYQRFYNQQLLVHNHASLASRNAKMASQATKESVAEVKYQLTRQMDAYLTAMTELSKRDELLICDETIENITQEQAEAASERLTIMARFLDCELFMSGSVPSDICTIDMPPDTTIERLHKLLTTP